MKLRKALLWRLSDKGTLITLGEYRLGIKLAEYVAKHDVSGAAHWRLAREEHVCSFVAGVLQQDEAWQEKGPLPDAASAASVGEK